MCASRLFASRRNAILYDAREGSLPSSWKLSSDWSLAGRCFSDSWSKQSIPSVLEKVIFLLEIRPAVLEPPRFFKLGAAKRDGFRGESQSMLSAGGG